MHKIMDFFLDRKNIIKKIIVTLIIVFVYVIGTNTYIPFLEPKSILKSNVSNIFVGLRFMDTNPCKILCLGISPYITASIIIQLLTKILPPLKELNKQGAKGQYRINLYTKLLTIFCAIIAGLSVITRASFFDIKTQKIEIFYILFFLVTGVFICIWLANLITAKGVSDGVSILIVLSISKEVFHVFKYLFDLKTVSDKLMWIKLFVLFLFVMMLIFAIVLCLTYVKIPINYVTDAANEKIDKHIPIKINSAGVLPIILVQTLLGILPMISAFAKKGGSVQNFINSLTVSRDHLGLFFFVYILLIVLFSFFTVFMNLNPSDMAQNLSQKDVFLEGVKPGEETVYKLTHEIFKVAIIGTIGLTLLTIMPDLISYFVSRPEYLPDFKDKIHLGGTSFLIVVGVTIETIQNLVSKKTNVHKMYNKLF